MRDRVRWVEGQELLRGRERSLVVLEPVEGFGLELEEQAIVGVEPQRLARVAAGSGLVSLSKALRRARAERLGLRLGGFGGGLLLPRRLGIGSLGVVFLLLLRLGRPSALRLGGSPGIPGFIIDFP
ncbi:MAG: hypothetical protein HY748_04310 [Elusimicrobia bacterium]|nr:hypothetical protein [Elusimicrobiota bacterium]